MTRAGRRQVWTVGLLVLGGGCGDRLLSGRAYEAPLFTFQGALNPVPEDLVSPRVDVVWVDPAALSDDLPAPPEDSVFELDGAHYVYSLFAPPPAAAIRALVDPDTGGLIASFAFGEIVLVEDLDGDGAFRVGSLADGSKIVSDDYRGAQSAYVVSFIERSAAPGVGPPELQRLLSAKPGYHLGFIDCSTLDVPQASVRDGNASSIEITVLPAPASELPFLRKCLRSHPVAPTGGATPS